MISASFHFSLAPEDAISVILSNESHVVACAGDGTPRGGELAKANTQVSVYRGSIPLTYDTDWTVDEYVSDGAIFSRLDDVISLTSFDANSMGGYCDITIMLLPQQKYITKRFSVTRNIETPTPFCTGEPWSLNAAYVNGQYLYYENIVYKWSYYKAGNSTVNPKDDIANNPTVTHWKAYPNWEILATDIALARLIKASEIDVDSLVAKLLKTANSGPRVEIFGSMLNVYGNFANPNIRFGVNANGQAVLTYYDNNGNKIYDLGPKGFDWGSIVPSSWSTIRLTKICNVLTNDAIPSWYNITSQALTSFKNVTASTGSDFYQYYAGSNPSLTETDRANEKYLFVSESVGSSKIEDGWYAYSASGEQYLQYMSEGTNNYIKPDNSAIYENSAGVIDHDPIYTYILYEYVNGVQTRQINVFWNGNIVY